MDNETIESILVIVGITLLIVGITFLIVGITLLVVQTKSLLYVSDHDDSD